MLDQKAFAGLGNYLPSEILFAAGVHPDARPSDLDDSTVRAWSQAIKQITVQAYETGGITVDPDTAERGKIAGEPLGEHGVIMHSVATTVLVSHAAIL